MIYYINTLIICIVSYIIGYNIGHKKGFNTGLAMVRLVDHMKKLYPEDYPNDR